MEHTPQRVSSPHLSATPSPHEHQRLTPSSSAAGAAVVTPMASPETPVHEELQDARSPFSTPCSTRIASPQVGLTFVDPYENNNNTSTSNEAVEDELVRRLRRENRLLRCQLLRSQREQGHVAERQSVTPQHADSKPQPNFSPARALTSAAELDAVPRPEPFSSRAQSAVCLSEMRELSQQGSERQLPSQPVQATTATTQGTVEDKADVMQRNVEENEALWLRLQTLQRQAERERARRVATERELRQEIERLRLALEIAEEARARAIAAVAVASPSDAHARAASFPTTTTTAASSPDIAGDEEDGNEEANTEDALHVVSDVLSHHHDTEQDVIRHHHIRSNSANATSSSKQPDVQALHGPHYSHHSRVTSDLSFAAARNAQALTSNLNPNNATYNYERSATDYGVLTEDFVYAKRGDGAVLAAFERPLADALHRESADRRERRRLRLQQLVPTASNAEQTNECIATANTNAGNEAIGSNNNNNTHDALVDRRGGGHATVASPLLAQAARSVLVNPNQIGIEIHESERNRTWYLRRVLGLTLVHMVAPTRRQQVQQQTMSVTGAASATQVTSMNASQVQSDVGSPGGGVSRQTSTTLAPQETTNANKSSNGGVAIHDSPLMSTSTSSSTTSSSTTVVSPATSRTAGTLLADGDTAGTLPYTSNSVMNSGSGMSAPVKATPLVYKEVSPIALQRAIKETVVLHFRCVGNEPQLVTDSRRRNAHHTSSTSSGSRHSAPAFEEENSDVQLRAAFATATSQSNTALVSDNTTTYNDNEQEEGYAAVSSSSAALTRNVRSGHHNIYNETNSTSNSGSNNNGYREDEVRVSFHAPVIFGQIRDYLRLDADAFRTAAATATWRQSLSPGKSGTTLYFFGDFILKSLRESEFAFLCNKYLPAYVQYCERNPHTMLARFYAVLTVEWLQLGTRRRYVLMHNVFQTRYYIHRIYDVKGSRVGRTARRPDGSYPRNAYGALLLKDNDLPPQLILCGAYRRAIVLAQFRSDVYFLLALGIVDYSCMIGVRSRICTNTTRQQRGHEHVKRVDMTKEGTASSKTVAESATHVLASGEKRATAEEYADCEQPCEDDEGADDEDGSACIHGCDGGLLSLPLYTGGEDTTTAREDVYYLGIIDVLQEYNSVKKLESFAKGLVNDRRDISVVPPKDYADRLIHLLERIIV